MLCNATRNDQNAPNLGKKKKRPHEYHTLYKILSKHLIILTTESCDRGPPAGGLEPKRNDRAYLSQNY